MSTQDIEITNPSLTLSDVNWLGEARESGLVSVVIPTYNRTTLLIEAMDSVFKQTYRPIELIIVDDGSEVDTKSLVDEWKQHYPDHESFNTVFLKQNNRGPSAARNFGARVSHGEYLQFHDSDDLLLPDKLSDAVNAYRQDQTVDLVYCAWIVKTNDRSLTMPGPDLEQFPFVAEVVLRYLPTFPALYKCSVLNRAGPWNEALTCSEDREYDARIVSQIRKAKRIQNPGGIYRLHVSTNGISGDGNPRHPISAWHANKLMRSLVLHESSPLQREALNSLSARNLSNAARALGNGSRQYCCKILLSDLRIWLLSARNAFLATGLLFGTILPKPFQQLLVGYIEPRIWNK